MERKSPPPSLFAVLALPYGVLVNGLIGTVLSYLLRQEGVPVDRIANEVALLGLPTMLYFLWSPLTDFWIRRRNWLMLSAGLSAAALFAAFNVRSFADPLAVVLLLVAVSLSMLTSACSGGLMGSVVREEQKTKAGAFYQGRIPEWWRAWGRWAAGPSTALEPARGRSGLGRPDHSACAGSARRGRTEIGEARRRGQGEIARDGRGVPGDFSSVGVSAVAFAPRCADGKRGCHWPAAQPGPGLPGSPPSQVAWINGVAGGLLTALGAMLMTMLPKRIDARIGYPVAGLVNALCLLVLCVGHPRSGILHRRCGALHVYDWRGVCALHGSCAAGPGGRREERRQPVFDAGEPGKCSRGVHGLGGRTGVQMVWTARTAGDGHDPERDRSPGLSAVVRAPSRQCGTRC